MHAFGPARTERQVAAKLGAALGNRLRSSPSHSRAGSTRLVDAGFSQHIAEVMAELCDAEQRGILTRRGDRTVRCATELDETLAALVGVPA